MTNIDNLDLIRNGEPCSLAYCSLTIYPGNIYEPRHRRLIYREEGETTFHGVAFDADWAVLADVQAETKFKADDALASALNALFRGSRQAGLTVSQRPVPEVAR